MSGANEALVGRERELRARGRRTMEKLLDAGIEVFARKGFHAARVDDVVKAAHTSHGTFYLYFAGKEDLFSALAADVVRQMEDLAGSLGALTPDEAGEAGLRAWLEQLSEVYRRCGPVIAAWTEAETEEGEVGRIGSDVLGALALALARRIAGSPADLDPQAAALALVAMIERYHYYALSGMTRADRDGALDTLAAVTHAGLFGTCVCTNPRIPGVGAHT